MPLYEYDCETCQKHLEIIQKFSDAPLSICPECQGMLVKRLSLTSFKLKGTGWYNTDYRKPSTSSEKGKSSETPSAPEKTAKGKDK